MGEYFPPVGLKVRDVSDPAIIKSIVHDAGFDPELMLAEASRELTKNDLAERTDAAIQKGVFGVPTMIADGQMFWGYDDFQFLRLYLEGKDPLASDMLSAWSHVQPTANR